MHLQSAIATGLSRLKPLPWAGCLQSVIAICKCNRTILAQTPPLGGEPAECNCNLQLQPSWSCSHPPLGGGPAECNCNLQLQPSWFCSDPLLGGEPAECNCNLQLQPSHLGSDPLLGGELAECNCNLQLQPSNSAVAAGHLQLLNCSRASAIVTENAHAHMQLELRLSISIIEYR